MDREPHERRRRQVKNAKFGRLQQHSTGVVRPARSGYIGADQKRARSPGGPYFNGNSARISRSSNAVASAARKPMFFLRRPTTTCAVASGYRQARPKPVHGRWSSPNHEHDGRPAHPRADQPAPGSAADGRYEVRHCGHRRSGNSRRRYRSPCPGGWSAARRSNPIRATGNIRRLRQHRRQDDSFAVTIERRARQAAAPCRAIISLRFHRFRPGGCDFRQSSPCS